MRLALERTQSTWSDMHTRELCYERLHWSIALSDNVDKYFPHLGSYIHCYTLSVLFARTMTWPIITLNKIFAPNPPPFWMFRASPQHTEILWNSTNSYSDWKQNQCGMWPLNLIKTANTEKGNLLLTHR